MSILNEKQPILKDTSSGLYPEEGETELHVYKRRWWITLVFAMGCIAQAMVWDSFGPVAESTEVVLGWTDDVLAQIINMSGFSYVLTVLPIGVSVDAIGLRKSFLFCEGLLLIGTLLRCITLEPTIFTPLAYIGQTFQGISGAISFSGPAMFAAVWFPLNQRTSITALISFCNNLGVILMFIIGPQLIPNPIRTVFPNIQPMSSLNETTTVLYNYEISFKNGSQETVSQTMNIDNTTRFSEIDVVVNFDDIKQGISNLMYFHAGLAGLVFVLAVIYFPSKPPKPPSITASSTKIKYGKALKEVVSNVQLWIIGIAGALPRACFGDWIAYIDVVLKPLGVSQIDAGLIGVWSTLAGCIAGFVFAKFSDFLSSRRKVMLITMSIAAIAIGIWAALLCSSIIEFDLTSMYVCSILFGILVNGPGPLFYEISAETAYPVGEGVAGGFYTLLFAGFEVVFFSVLSIPGIGVIWMTWACVGSLIISLPLLLIFKENNKRYDIDINM